MFYFILLVLEKIIRDTNIRPREEVRLQEFSVPLFVYVGDLVFIDKSQDTLTWLFDRRNKATRKAGLQVNENKSDYTVIERRDGVDICLSLKVRNREFDSVRWIKYLRSRKNKIEKEVVPRILSEYKCFYVFAKILGWRSLLKKLKIL